MIVEKHMWNFGLMKKNKGGTILYHDGSKNVLFILFIVLYTLIYLMYWLVGGRMFSLSIWIIADDFQIA